MSRQMISAASSSISHIDKLPIELLILVFEACVSSDLEVQLDVGSTFPPRLLRVCRLWHSVAISVPILWSALRVDITIDFNEEVIPEMIERRIGRTGDNPIALSLGFEPGALAWNRPLNLPWWKVAHLELDDQNLHPNQAWEVLARCASLVTCYLEVDGFAYVDDKSSSDEEEWGGGYILGDADEFSGDEDEGYESGDEDGSEGDDSSDDVDSGDDDDDETLILPLLRVLSVTFDSQVIKENRAFPGGACINPLFNRLLLPALEVLTIAAEHSAVDNDLLPALIELHAFSRFKLTSLRICNIRFEVDDLYRLLLNLNTLEDLCIQSPTFAHSLPDLMENLEYIPTKATTNILPNLEALSILDHVLPRDQEATDDISLRVLESRSWSDGQTGYSRFGLSRLKKASISWSQNNTSDYADIILSSERVGRLRKQGMTLSYPTLD